MSVRRIGNRLWQTVLHVTGDLTVAEVRDLMTGRHHSTLVQRRRAMMIVSRVRVVAMMFALLTPLWIVVDFLYFPWELWIWMVLLRLVATAAFLAVALGFRGADRMSHAYRALACLLVIPTGAFLISHALLAQYPLPAHAQTLAIGYVFLPFVMVAGLSVFPITAVEGLLFGIPVLLAQLHAGISGPTMLIVGALPGAMWLLGLLLAVATLAGMSQLHFMMVLGASASHDGLTQAFTRRVGEELLDQQFQHAVRSNAPLAVAFIDLDNFKVINDRFSHEHGDVALARTAESLRDAMRVDDILVRWGGEEFLLIMPHTDCIGATRALQRWRVSGIGSRPDGIPLTASIGIAERMDDMSQSWQALVTTADRRMYLAKRGGKDRLVWCGMRAGVLSQ